jgi:hypothetical protein
MEYKIRPMTGAEIKAIEDRIDAASPGPWISCHADKCLDNWPICPSLGVDFDGHEYAVSTDHVHASQMGAGGAKADSEFIAHARLDVLKLLAYIRFLRVEK